MKSKTAGYSRIIKEAALRHGFMGAGISRAGFMEDEARRLEEWLAKGYQGEMSYMANHLDLRTDPTRLVPGAKSVVSLMFNYYPDSPTALPPVLPPDLLKGEKNSFVSQSINLPPDLPPDPLKGEMNFFGSQSMDLPPAPLKGEIKPSLFERSRGDDTVHPADGSMKIGSYAIGEDYHKVLRRKLKAMVAEIRQEMGDFHARVFVDSAPVLERDWARRSGLGWIGRNTLLIDPKKGSYFFLAEIILDVELEYDAPIRDHCGTCTRCIDACPTDAIAPEGYVLDGSKCLSYLTIELKSAIPDEFKDKMEGWIFGCDICQEVCPWNRFSAPHQEPAFASVADFTGMTDRDWIEMTEDIFVDRFGKTPLKRAGLGKLKETVRFVINTD